MRTPPSPFSRETCLRPLGPSHSQISNLAYFARARKVPCLGRRGNTAFCARPHQSTRPPARRLGPVHDRAEQRLQLCPGRRVGERFPGVGQRIVAVTASLGCPWRAASNVPWISITENSVATGSATVSYAVDPNTTAAQRSGTLTIAGKTFTVTQSGGSAAYAPPVHSLGLHVIAADYSKALDRMIIVSAEPNQLNIYDPVSRANTAVPLLLLPTSVSVSPDGLHAAVGTISTSRT